MSSECRASDVTEQEDRPIGGFAIREQLGTTSVELGLPAVGPAATTVGIRELARNVSGVVGEVVRSGQPAIVTKHGAPFAAIVPIDRGESTALAVATNLIEQMAAADREAGRTRSSSEVFAELARLAEALARAASLETV